MELNIKIQTPIRLGFSQNSYKKVALFFGKKIFLFVHCRRTCLYTSPPGEVFDGIALGLGDVMKIFVSYS